MSKPGTQIGRWYRNRRWATRAASQLALHPLCAMCLADGVVCAASVADHVIPHKGNDYLFWCGELQSLCFSHHNATKQEAEKRGFNTDIGADGFPVDPMHPFRRLEGGEHLSSASTVQVDVPDDDLEES